MNRAAALAATFFGIGRIPVASGTVASLVALLFGWWFALLGGWHAILALSITAFVAGIWACGVHARTLGVKDPSDCVLDEFAGQWLAMVPLAAMGLLLDFPALLLCFALFRVLDIAKPWPISRLERLPGGLGIMADDMLAGAVAGGLVALAAAIGWV
jgi:phosphatidylglycerophosphatase A